MTTPDRRILVLASVLLLLLLQVAPASALCTCETPCAQAADRAAADEAPGSCCGERADEVMPSFEGVCCMAGGTEAEVSTVVALPQVPTPELDVAALHASKAPGSPQIEIVQERSLLRPRSAPPSPPPIFLLTGSFLN